MGLPHNIIILSMHLRLVAIWPAQYNMYNAMCAHVCVQHQHISPEDLLHIKRHGICW